MITKFHTILLLLAALAPSITTAQEDKNPLVPIMIEIPATEFMIGRDESQRGESDELPRHPVKLSAHEIGKYEVTNSQYVAVLNWALQEGRLQNAQFTTYDQSGGDIYMKGRLLKVINEETQIIFERGQFKTIMRDGIFMDDHPVVNVTWPGAVAYANWLSEIQGYTPAYDFTTFRRVTPLNDGYRLPTEAEWEHAAGWNTDGKNDTWNFANASDSLTHSQANYQLQNPLKPFGLNSYPYTTPIGFFDGSTEYREAAISPRGCYDMSGNVQEWCEDWFAPYSPTTQSDPTGPPEGVFKVVRGGGWNSMKNSCRTTNRGWTEPFNKFHSFGFRLARTPK